MIRANNATGVIHMTSDGLHTATKGEPWRSVSQARSRRDRSTKARRDSRWSRSDDKPDQGVWAKQEEEQTWCGE